MLWFLFMNFIRNPFEFPIFSNMLEYLFVGIRHSSKNYYNS